MKNRSLAQLAALSCFASTSGRTDYKHNAGLGLVLHIDDDALSGGGGTDVKKTDAPPAGDESTDVNAIDASTGIAQQTQQAGSASQQGDGTGSIGTDAVNTDPLAGAENQAAVGDPPADQQQ